MHQRHPIARAERIRLATGLSASLVLHAALGAGLLGWRAGAVLLPETAGQQAVVSLHAVFSQPQAEAPAADAPQLDAAVVITPDEARIAQRRFVAESTRIETVPPPDENAISPPRPVAVARAAMVEQGLPSPSASARVLPRLAPAAVETPASAASLPQSPGSQAAQPPELLANLPPSYPAEAVRKGWQGTVVLRVVVRPDGQAGEVTVFSSSGYPVLDAAAVHAVRRWRFRPALRDGVPIEMAIKAPIRFER